MRSAMIVFLAIALPAAALDVTGEWTSNWGPMHLTQQGNRVTGTYDYEGGTIEGTVAGNRLTFWWTELPSRQPDGDAGDAFFDFTPDGMSFSGSWCYGHCAPDNGDWWGSRASAPPPATFTLPFTDDFAPQQDGRWIDPHGVWMVSGYGRYYNSSGDQRLAVIGDPNWTDYIVEADFEGSYDGGLMVRARDVDNGVALIVRPSWGDIYWHHRANGSWDRMINWVSLPYPEGSTLHVMIRVEGPRAYAYVDGQLLTEVETPGYPSGLAGVYTTGGEGQGWANFVVRPLDEPASPPAGPRRVLTAAEGSPDWRNRTLTVHAEASCADAEPEFLHDRAREAAIAVIWREVKAMVLSGEMTVANFIDTDAAAKAKLEQIIGHPAETHPASQPGVYAADFTIKFSDLSRAVLPPED